LGFRLDSVAVITTLIVAALVGYLAVTRNDTQQPLEDRPGRPVTVKDDVVGR
jgi:hypothetical protein